MRVLIVDDENDMRQSLRMLIEAYFGCEVFTAANGQQALEFLCVQLKPREETPVDLVLTDVSMPGMNGIDFCTQLKAIPEFAEIPVLVITGRGNESVLQRAFDAGAHDFLPKGTSSVELLARIRAAFHTKKLLDDRRIRELELLETTQKLERLNEKLQRLSMVDELTKIPNRRFFNLLLKREWARSQREGSPLCLLMIDVDWFKDFNDRYGHPAGDACLTRVAGAIAESIRRPGDTGARFGGEEFVILLPSTGLQGAMKVAESLRQSVSKLDIPHEGSPFQRVSVSIGAASAIGCATAEQLLQNADRALYRAKANGRNTCEKADAAGSLPASDSVH